MIPKPMTYQDEVQENGRTGGAVSPLMLPAILAPSWGGFERGYEKMAASWWLPESTAPSKLLLIDANACIGKNHKTRSGALHNSEVRQTLPAFRPRG